MLDISRKSQRKHSTYSSKICLITNRYLNSKLIKIVARIIKINPVYTCRRYGQDIFIYIYIYMIWRNTQKTVLFGIFYANWSIHMNLSVQWHCPIFMFAKDFIIVPTTSGFIQIYPALSSTSQVCTFSHRNQLKEILVNH